MPISRSSPADLFLIRHLLELVLFLNDSDFIQSRTSNADLEMLISTFHCHVSGHSSISIHNLVWLKHASIDIMAKGDQFLDTELATQIQELDDCCPALRTLTLLATRVTVKPVGVHLVQELAPDGLAAKALRTLRPRLDRLSITTYGARGKRFRQSITAAGNLWVKEDLADPPPISGINTQIACFHALPGYSYIPSRKFLSCSAYAYHIFGREIAQKLEDGRAEKKDWFFNS